MRIWPLFPSPKNQAMTPSLSIQLILDAFIQACVALKPDPNIIEKLSFYTEILLDASQICDDKFVDSLEALQPSRIRKDFDKETYDQNLCQFFECFAHVLQTITLDENVLVYLLEKKDELNLFLGKGRIETLFYTLFPEGNFALKSTLLNKYSLRGFESFYQRIEPLIDKIAWGQPWQLTTRH